MPTVIDPKEFEYKELEVPKDDYIFEFQNLLKKIGPSKNNVHSWDLCMLGYGHLNFDKDENGCYELRDETKLSMEGNMLMSLSFLPKDLVKKRVNILKQSAYYQRLLRIFPCLIRPME